MHGHIEMLMHEYPFSLTWHVRLGWYPWWGVDLVSQKSTVASNSFARGHSFLVYGHRCGACHNASDAQVRNKRMQCTKAKWCEWFFLTKYSSSPVSSFFGVPPVVAQGRPYMLFWGLAVVIGFYSSG